MYKLEHKPEMYVITPHQWGKGKWGVHSKLCNITKASIKKVGKATGFCRRVICLDLIRSLRPSRELDPQYGGSLPPRTGHSQIGTSWNFLMLWSSRAQLGGSWNRIHDQVSLFHFLWIWLLLRKATLYIELWLCRRDHPEDHCKDQSSPQKDPGREGMLYEYGGRQCKGTATNQVMPVVTRGRNEGRSPQSRQQEHKPSNTFTLDFWPPEKWENKFLLLHAMKSVVVMTTLGN